MWVGFLLLAVVTSLPELFNGISSVALVKAPDLTMGDLFGSNVINLLILAALDVVHHNRPLLTAATSRHLLPAGLSMVLVAFGAGSILISTRVHELGIGWIGIYTPVLVLLYLLMIRIVLGYERRQASQSSEQTGNPEYDAISSRRAYLSFAVSASFVIGAGTWLAFIGEDITEATGWDESFVGSLFMAVATSLPEISVSFAALQLGAVDMAIADIFGSNMFNMLIIGADDLFFREGPVLAAVSESHAVTGLIVLGMTGIVMLGLVYRARNKTRLGFSWYVPLLFGLFVLSAYMSFTRPG